MATKSKFTRRETPAPLQKADIIHGVALRNSTKEELDRTKKKYQKLAPEPLSERWYEFEVITPVLGGGTHWDDKNRHLRTIDPVTPIRIPSIRGQLRFWWRATHGCLLPSLKAMREAEGQLWGLAAQPGLVSLQLDDRSRFSTNPSNVPNNDGIMYGAFPTRPAETAKDRSEGKLTTIMGRAMLKVIAPDEYWSQVETAIHAWLLFGGLGARTRRGFGAVRCTNHSLNKSHSHLLKSPRDFIESLSGEPLLQLVPSLCGAKLWQRSKRSTAQEALDDALSALKSFRQHKTNKKNSWPEPKRIRSICNAGGNIVNSPNGLTFPRAGLGMPMIFQQMFKHNEIKISPWSKDKERRKNADRMASPIILRPTPVGDRFAATAILLKIPGRERIPISFQEEQAASGLSDEDRQVLRMITHHDGYADVATAFLGYFAK